jgi:hypothetical protein
MAVQNLPDPHNPLGFVAFVEARLEVLEDHVRELRAGGTRLVDRPRFVCCPRLRGQGLGVLDPGQLARPVQWDPWAMAGPGLVRLA